jgi:endonuclease/exonuclease/phosphatase family metal-dependent hydrolase
MHMKPTPMKTCSRRLVASTVVAVVAAGLVNSGTAAAQNTSQNTNQPKVNPTAMTLKVMTYNLRYASNTPPNSWPQRRPVAKQMLTVTSPDIIGTQEGVYAQIKDLAADHPEYSWIGLGRDGGSRGEFMAVFYRTQRFEPLEFDHFWLSDTPDVIGSKNWGNTIRRMVTWIKFLDRQSNQQFYLWNTHLDHKSQEAREKGALLITQRIKAMDTTLPIILTGDFNAVSRQNRTYDILTQDGGFSDAWFTAARRIGKNLSTFHNYKAPVENGAHIDWILTRGAVTTQDVQIVDFQDKGQYPSDHFPLIATLTVNPVQNPTP